MYMYVQAFKAVLPAASESMQQVRRKLESRASTGFIVNRDWQRILDTRVSGMAKLKGTVRVHHLYYSDAEIKLLKRNTFTNI